MTQENNVFNPYKDIITTVAVDFDGTLVDSDLNYYPEALEAITNMYNNGIRIILWTCRPVSFIEDYLIGNPLNTFEFYRINEDCEEIKKHYSENSRKIFAHFYIDNQSLGYRELSWSDKAKIIIDWHNRRV